MAIQYISSGNQPVVEKIADKVRTIDVTTSGAWPDLDSLSTRTVFDFVEVLEDSIAVEDDRFVAPINVYVELHYGNEDDANRTSEAFPGRAKGRIGKKGEIIIEDVEVDTRSFYE